MPPKTPKTEEGDELNIVKGQLQAKDLIIMCSMDNIVRLEERAKNLENMIKDMQETAETRDQKLEQQIETLTKEAKSCEQRSREMERAMVLMKKERVENRIQMFSELNNLKTTRKAEVDGLQAELSEAHRLIQEIKEFTAKRASIVRGIQDLREHLAKEQKGHQDALGDVERAALQEREKLRREMFARIEETKIEMTKQTEEQLHYKTKRTIHENDQLAKEVAYHLRQADLLTEKNGRISHENMVMEDKILTAIELEEDLSRKNHNFQKAARILLFKLQEQHLSTNLEVIEEMDELKHLIARREQIKAEIQKDQKDVERAKTVIEERAKRADKAGATDEVVKFLYMTIEDVELEEAAGVDTSIYDDGNPLETSSRLDMLTIQQRQNFVRHLLRIAISIRGLMEGSLASESKGMPGTFGAWSHVLYAGRDSKGKVSLEDTLAVEIDAKEVRDFIPTRRKSCGVETEVLCLQQSILELVS